MLKLKEIFSHGLIKGVLFGVLLVTLLWAIAPTRSSSFVDDAVEIHYMIGGPLQGPEEDVVREFERLSRERHAIDPSYPAYRIIAGQSAARNQTEDPTRFLLSVAGGMPPDVIRFDRYAINEWAARGTFTPLDDYVQRDLDVWESWQRKRTTDPNVLPP